MTGVPGVGKTSLALEFALRGAIMGEKGLVLTTVERPQKMVASVPEFDFYDQGLIDNGTLEIRRSWSSSTATPCTAPTT